MFVGIRTDDGDEVLYSSNSVELPSARSDWITVRRLLREQAQACNWRARERGRLSAGRTLLNGPR